jgi:hypothetical protein
MKSVFDTLREELDSVGNWVDDHLTRPRPSKERALVASLRKHMVHCRLDKGKWRSESEAMAARIKVKNAWMHCSQNKRKGTDHETKSRSFRVHRQRNRRCPG